MRSHYRWALWVRDLFPDSSPEGRVSPLGGYFWVERRLLSCPLTFVLRGGLDLSSIGRISET